MYTGILSSVLAALGITGITILITVAGIVLWYYRGSRTWSFRWHWRNVHLMQVSAIACLFFLAMTASYGILGSGWTWIYLLGAVKTGSWWLKYAINLLA